jgi:plasmid stabilization system protein ParE
MTPRVVFRPEARAEVREARDWYEAQSVGLGLEFARAVDAMLSTIRRTPALYPVVVGAARRALLRRFPYQIIYEATAEEIVVVACFHHRRDPRVWWARI